MAFLKDRRKKTASPQGRANETIDHAAMEVDENKSNHEHNQNIAVEEERSFDPHREFKIDKQMPGMGLIEEEKFQWMKESPKPTWKGIKVSKFDVSE